MLSPWSDLVRDKGSRKKISAHLRLSFCELINVSCDEIPQPPDLTSPGLANYIPIPRELSCNMQMMSYGVRQVLSYGAYFG